MTAATRASPSAVQCGLNKYLGRSSGMAPKNGSKPAKNAHKRRTSGRLRGRRKLLV
jgi:hypothetical protein